MKTKPCCLCFEKDVVLPDLFLFHRMQKKFIAFTQCVLLQRGTPNVSIMVMFFGVFFFFFTVSELPLKTIYFEMPKNSDTRLNKMCTINQNSNESEFICLCSPHFCRFKHAGSVLASSVKVWNDHYRKQVSALVVMREYNIHYNQITQSWFGGDPYFPQFRVRRQWRGWWEVT